MSRRAAVVTGASGGIGTAFAHRLAPDHDLLLVGRSETKLAALRDELALAHPGGRFEDVLADLARSDGPERVAEAVRAGNWSLDLLVNNAGFGTHGPFLGNDPQRVQEEIAVDCAAVAALTRLLAPAMVGRRQGGILNVGSLAGFQPIPNLAVYAAAKAFVIAFSEAIRDEFRGSGVSVAVVCPGTVETTFFDTAGAQFMINNRLSAEQVVSAGLAALEAGGGISVPGRLNKLTAFSTRIAPRRWQPRLARWVARARN